MGTADFDALVLNVLRRLTKSEGAMWTGDITYSVQQRERGVTNSAVRASLKRLEKRGAARRVVEGNPTSWEATKDLTP